MGGVTFRVVRGFFIAAMLLPTMAVAQVRTNGNFVAQGPAPDGGKDSSNSGAVQAILSGSPLAADTDFIGTTNGGIWRTTDRGQTWMALTDHQASLSIASLGITGHQVPAFAAAHGPLRDLMYYCIT
jgi:hypothetical protein